MCSVEDCQGGKADVSQMKNKGWQSNRPEFQEYSVKDRSIASFHDGGWRWHAEGEG